MYGTSSPTSGPSLPVSFPGVALRITPRESTLSVHTKYTHLSLVIADRLDGGEFPIGQPHGVAGRRSG